MKLMKLYQIAKRDVCMINLDLMDRKDLVGHQVQVDLLEMVLILIQQDLMDLVISEI